MGFFGDILRIGGSILGGPIGGLIGNAVAGGLESKKKKATDPYSGILASFQPQVEKEAEFNLANLNKRLNSKNYAYSLLTGQNDTQLYRNYMNAGNGQGLRNARTLSDLGYSSGVADASVLDASNKKAAAGNAYLQNLKDPSQLARKHLMAADIYDNGGLSALVGLQGASNSNRMAQLQYDASRPNSFLETLLQIGGEVAPIIIAGQKQKSAMNIGKALGKMPW